MFAATFVGFAGVTGTILIGFAGVTGTMFFGFAGVTGTTDDPVTGVPSRLTSVVGLTGVAGELRLPVNVGGDHGPRVLLGGEVGPPLREAGDHGPRVLVLGAELGPRVAGDTG